MNAVANMYDLASRAGPFGIALMDTARVNPLLYPAAYPASLPVSLSSAAVLRPPTSTLIFPPVVATKKTGFSIEDILHPSSSGESEESREDGRCGRGATASNHGSVEEAKCIFSSRLLQTSAARTFFRLNDPLRHHFNPGPYHHSVSTGSGYGATHCTSTLSPASISVPIPVPVYLRGKSPSGSPHDAARSAKKCRRSRTVFTELQLMGLEKRFERQKYLSTPDRLELADTLGLSQLQVKTWYQNRRMKWKKQVLQGGSQEAPTKPKGRPKKCEFHESVSSPSPLTPPSAMASPPTSPPASPASSCYSDLSSDLQSEQQQCNVDT